MVEKERLRFDFSNPKAMTAEEIANVELFVNTVIATGENSTTTVMNVEDAKKSGAMALFGEKYGDEVRVVRFGDASVELCGGTHVPNVAHIGSFFIIKESGVSAGVRRIEAICGNAALSYAQQLRAELEVIKETVKHKEPLMGINRLKEEIKTLKSEVESLNASAGKAVESLHVNGVELIVEILSAGDIKARIDDLKNEKEAVAVLLLQVKEDKVLIAAGVKNANIKAGAWIKEIAPVVGGGGGGRDDFAQAGGKDASRIEEAKIAALVYAKAQLQG